MNIKGILVYHVVILKSDALHGSCDCNNVVAGYIHLQEYDIVIWNCC